MIPTNIFTPFMHSLTRSEMKNYSSTLFHNILNPLTILSLEIEHQQTVGPKLQNQVDTMLHYLTHLEYFVSMLCDNVKHHFFYKQISVNTELEKVLEIISYSAKQKHIQILSLFLSEVYFETNQLLFHQHLLELFQIFLVTSEENQTNNQKIELTLQKKKAYFSMTLSFSNISFDAQKLILLQKKFEKTYNATFHIKKTDGHSPLTLKFPLVVTPPETKVSPEEPPLT